MTPTSIELSNSIHDYLHSSMTLGEVAARKAFLTKTVKDATDVTRERIRSGADGTQE